MPNKTLTSNSNAMEGNDTLTYDTRSISTTYKIFFSNSAESLLTNLQNPPEKHNLESVVNYYFSFIFTNDFSLKIKS